MNRLLRNPQVAIALCRDNVKPIHADKSDVKLDRLSLETLDGPLLRQVRAVELLERIGTTEAKELLRSWAGGDSSLRLTSEAVAASKRLAR
jgi:hypothetical protein